MSASGDDALEMPCLGRPFQLGMLYDCRSDRPILGMTLWDADVLKKATSSKPQTASDFKVIAEDSISEKTTSMDISASLKLSLLGGLVKVEGSAKYLDDRKSSKRQARVSLKYWSTTRVEQLTMEGLSKFQHTRVFDDKIATHVVTGVLYGAEAFFVFDRQVSESESYRDIHGRVEAMVKALPSIDLEIGGSAEVGIKQGEKEEASKFECTFYGDFLLKKNPSTFEEAVQVYRELPQLLGLESGENTVAKKVWLYPLSKLDSKAAQIVREISSNLVNQAQSILEDMHEVEMRSNDLMKYEVYFNFQGIRKQLSSFKGMAVEYRTDFTKCLTALLPQIRGGGTEETELATLYKAMHASPFSHLRLTSWLDGKEREVKVLKGYLESMQKSGSAIQFAFSPGSLDSLVHSIEHRYILCFAFKIAGKYDAYLKKMHAYLREEQTSEDFENATPSFWLENNDLTSDMMLQARQFRSFAEANSGRAGLKCVVTDWSEGDSGSNKGAVIALYTCGKQKPFEPPGQPCKPKESNVTHDSIQLVWGKPEYGAQNVEFYTVSYTHTPTDPLDQWKSQATEGVQEALEVSGLAPKVVYYFQVRSECSVGVSMYSEVSDPIETKPRTAENTLAERMRAKCGPPIEDGPPAIYKLPAQDIMRDGTKHIAKCHIGSKPGHFSSQEKVLMVLGATGAGKSTLINAMANYILGVRWEDDFRFKLIVDEASTTQAHSQTSWITAYTFPKMKGSKIPYTLTIIDTPGFGDTRGLERDREITGQIKEFFSIRGRNGIDHLDGIGFVTQADQARLTPTQQYVFSAILATFGKDVSDNIFMMVTFADGSQPLVMNAIKEADVPFSKSFKFNNSALFITNEDDDVEGDDEDENFGEMLWKMGLRNFKNFFTLFQTVEPKSLQLTQEVLEERQKLEANIQGLQKKIKNGLSQIDVLQQEERILKTRKTEIEANKKFKYKIKVPKHKKIDLHAGTYVTNCLQCNFTCHYPCKIAKDGSKYLCAAMDNGGSSNAKCTVCPGRCHWTKHVNNPYRFEEYEEEEERTIEDLKKRYEEATSGKTTAESMILNMENHLKFLHTKILEMIRQIKDNLKRLDEIALRPNPLNEVEFIELLIQSEKDQSKDGWQQRVQCYEEMKKQAVVLRTVTTDEEVTQLMQKGSERWWEKLKFW